MLERVAQYRIERKLGEGGMGVVYAARDERLDRDVAIKMIRAGTSDGMARERLWREARAAAAVNHPHLCQLIEIGENDSELFIVMELLEGESLAARLARGPLEVVEAAQVGLQILDALEPLHRRGILHRDLKPSNIFLTPHGVKLLDFGLARWFGSGFDSLTPLTTPGMLVGTPHYLAPELIASEPVDARADLFAVGAVLYEALSGQKAFPGRNVMEVIRAVCGQEPPPLGGNHAAAQLDRVVRRALAKKPERRHASAQAMAAELRAALLLEESGGRSGQVRPLRRMIVLPFRLLRPDADTDFLAFSLPDAIASSLSALESIVVRSSLTAAKFAEETPNLAEIAERADVDTVLTGTLLRSGDQVRVVTQLVEAPGGALVWSQTSQVGIGDLFQLQDSLTRRIVESLAVPLTGRDRRVLQRDVPADAQAYAFYLRANELAVQSRQWSIARDLYLQCVTLDPQFAPAWARLGRVYRLLAHYGGDQVEANFERAREAFAKALELNPELSVALYLSANLDVDQGRSEEAMVRLLHHAAHRPTDAELYAGLVQTCRYCGLLEAAIAAHEQAVRLDPAIRTSVHHAYLMRGDYQRSVDTNTEDIRFVDAFTLDLWGRREEALSLMRRIDDEGLPRLYKGFTDSIRLILEGRLDEARPVLETMYDHFTVRDPCATFYFARELARVGDVPRALVMLERSMQGFSCFEFMTRDPWLTPLRGEDAFRAILRRCEARERQARAAFIGAGGDRVLNVHG